MVAIMGIIRANTAETRKTTFKLVRLKTRLIIGGPMVIPTMIMVPCTDIKLARCSRGTIDVAMTCWPGKFSPWAIPNKIVGIRQSHILDITGTITTAKA
jgi:hypothetical protein